MRNQILNWQFPINQNSLIKTWKKWSQNDIGQKFEFGALISSEQLTIPELTIISYLNFGLRYIISWQEAQYMEYPDAFSLADVSPLKTEHSKTLFFLQKIAENFN